MPVYGGGGTHGNQPAIRRRKRWASGENIDPPPPILANIRQEGGYAFLDDAPGTLLYASPNDADPGYHSLNANSAGASAVATFMDYSYIDDGT